MPLMRMHFWLDVARLKGRVSLTRKHVLKGTIPALTNIKSGVVLRNQRGAVDNLVPPRAEEFEERASNVVGGGTVGVRGWRGHRSRAV